VIVFETVDAAQTALLLSNTEIAGRPITVELHEDTNNAFTKEERTLSSSKTERKPGGLDAPPVEFSLPTGAEPLSASDPVLHIVEVDDSYEPTSLTCSGVPSRVRIH
jgi:hypothetical protein